METFELQIVTPEKQIVQTRAVSLTAPGAEGELGILAKHAPMIAELVGGELFYRTADEEHRLAIAGGFLFVKHSRVSVLAESADLVSEISAEKTRLELERAKGDLAKSSSGIEILQAEAALKRALAQLRVYASLQRRKKT